VSDDGHRSSPWRRILATLVTLVLGLGVLIVFTPLGFFVVIPWKLHFGKRDNRREYGEHRANYDAAVLALAPLIKEPGRFYRFSISRDRNPSSLRMSAAVEDNYETATFVQAWRDEKGQLTVSFLTKDLHHLGMFWLYYLQAPPTPRDFLSGEQVEPVAPGWYAVYDPRG
jgi:hypothetical protein